VDQWHQLQGLSLETKVVVAVAIIVPIIIAVVAFVQWRISENRIAKYRREDQERDEERRKQEHDRRAQQAQADLLAKQAAFAFTRFPDEDNPVAVGGWLGDRMLAGELYSVGMAGATRVYLQAFLNDRELPRAGSWPMEQSLPVGTWLSYRFLLPFKVEPPGMHEGPWLDAALADAIVRFDVRFTDASAANRVLSYCFRFDPAPHPVRWKSRQVDC
jgi:hypothetical protein